MIIEFLLGFIFLAIGIVGLALNASVKTRCTEQITADIIDVFVQTERKGKKTYFPVYKYWYEGNEYRKKSNVGFSTPKYKAGDQVDIYIDPNEPKTIYSPKDMKGLKIALIISIVVGVIVISLAVKSYYELKEMNEAYEKYFAK